MQVVSVRVSLRPVDEQRADALLTEAGASELSYPEVGASFDPDLPSGYHHELRHVAVGHGEGAFRQGRIALKMWKAHEAAGIRVMPPGASPEIRTTVVFQLRTLGVYVFAACRIVAVVDESEDSASDTARSPCIPNAGEEAFLVECAHVQAQAGSAESGWPTTSSSPAGCRVVPRSRWRTPAMQSERVRRSLRTAQRLPLPPQRALAAWCPTSSRQLHGR